tara:strand:- start:4734 stop:5414 length:681 start_codon:yes stop_codon:yes gene_type:complete
MPSPNSERKVHWISRSSDVKIGKVLASYSPKDTCPDTCSLKSGGCYAWGLFYIGILGNKISDGRIKIKSLQEAIKKVRPDCKIARHRVAGDIVGDVKQTLEECEVISKAGITNIGYTHHWRAEEAQPLKSVFRASCQTLEEVEEARAMGWSATLIVSQDTPKKLILPNGERAFVCPARHNVPDKRDITCNDCTLCRVDAKTEDKTVMFRVHGTKKTIKSASEKIAQ